MARSAHTTSISSIALIRWTKPTKSSRGVSPKTPSAALDRRSNPKFLLRQRGVGFHDICKFLWTSPHRRCGFDRRHAAKLIGTEAARFRRRAAHAARQLDAQRVRGAEMTERVLSTRPL